MTKRKGDFRSKIDSILAEGDGEGAAPVSLATTTDETRTDSIEIGKIYLPKSRRPDQDVSELLSSVRRSGVLQPLLLRPVGSRYEVVDGARRLVAAQQTGRMSVPAVVRKLTAAEAKATASKDRPIVARSRAATKTVTASKAKAVRKATGRAPAQPPVRAIATAAAAAGPIAATAVPAATAATAATAKAAAKRPAAKKAAAGVSKPGTPAGRAPRRAAAQRLPSPTAGVQIFGDPPPPIALEPLPPIDVEAWPGEVGAPPAEVETELVAGAVSASSSATGSRHPVQAEREHEVTSSSPVANSVLSLPGRRPSRTRAMTGWYVFLAVLFVASFALTNLAINHEPSLSLATGGMAGVGLIAVVVILATGR